ncbi:hypothetical protein GWQ44_04810 [Pseudomonas sp. 3MA1]|uniref:hypothetical protein n=1 Tax=Pseudomonas sp. 3MA1 TaxID=2699196 RepID=UPI0023DD95A8|nr:hypothetical protein [Pseudomonas sp. 3MA1]MDF2394846.1 hypothetical protein [Pseudomonas sp. 3MA1]
MEENLRRLLLAFEDWLVREGLLGDAKFYTPAEWQKRGEDYHNDAVAIMVFDGSTVHHMLNFGCDLTEFDDIFESFGFWYELGHSWNLGIYPEEDFDFTPVARMSYSQLLRDPRWRRKADLVKKVAEHQCQDCGSGGRLEAHHCYYARMSNGFHPWEYPLGALRALCPDCHEKREKVEMSFRAWSAKLTHQQLVQLQTGVDHAGYWMGHNELFELLNESSRNECEELQELHKRVMSKPTR